MGCHCFPALLFLFSPRFDLFLSTDFAFAPAFDSFYPPSLLWRDKHIMHSFFLLIVPHNTRSMYLYSGISIWLCQDSVYYLFSPTHTRLLSRAVFGHYTFVNHRPTRWLPITGSPGSHMKQTVYLLLLLVVWIIPLKCISSQAHKICISGLFANLTWVHSSPIEGPHLKLRNFCQWEKSNK